MGVSSFERLRVEGPFQVNVITGTSPGARVSGDARALDGVEVRQDGETVVVRRPIARWEDQADPTGAAPITVTLSTPALASVSIIGSGAVAITGMKADRVVLSIAGGGTIAVADVKATEVNATTIGNGQITIAGQASRARLIVNGAGAIHADALEAGELTVRLDGPGEATGKARYTAQVTNTGLGRVVVAGTPRCLVKSAAGGPVTCGVAH